MTMFGWFNRYRHARGYGIHSPFAYRFITEVLEERLPYYDYSEMPGRLDRLVYRIACYFQPAVVCAYGEGTVGPMTKACPGALVSTSMPEMMVAFGDCDAGALSEAMARGCVIVLYARDKARFLLLRGRLDALGYGMTFDNGHDTVIIVPNRKLPRQDFSATF